MSPESSSYYEPKKSNNSFVPLGSTMKISYTEQKKHLSEAEKVNWEKTKGEIDAKRKAVKEQSPNPKNINEVKTPADFARWIDNLGEENLKKLEERMGTNNYKKILLLTFAGTAKELITMATDALKIGEGFAESITDLSYIKKEDLNELSRILYVSKGFGTDAFNMMIMAPAVSKGVRELAKILSKTDLSVSGAKGSFSRILSNQTGAIGPGVGDIIEKQALAKLPKLIGKGRDMPFHNKAAIDFASLLRKQALSVRDGAFSLGKEVWYEDIMNLYTKHPGFNAELKDKGFSILIDEAGPYLAKIDRLGFRPEPVFRFTQAPKLDGILPKMPTLGGEDALFRKNITRALEQDKLDLKDFSRIIAKNKSMSAGTQVGRDFAKSIFEGSENPKLIEAVKKAGYEIKQEIFHGDIKYVLKKSRGNEKRILLAF